MMPKTVTGWNGVLKMNERDDFISYLMAEATIKNLTNKSLPLLKITNMGATNDVDTLLACLDANNSDIPVGVCALQVGSSANPNKALIICIKVTGTAGRAFSVSPYAAINQLNLYLSSDGWLVSQ